MDSDDIRLAGMGRRNGAPRMIDHDAESAVNAILQCMSDAELESVFVGTRKTYDLIGREIVRRAATDEMRHFSVSRSKS